MFVKKVFHILIIKLIYLKQLVDFSIIDTLYRNPFAKEIPFESIHIYGLSPSTLKHEKM